MAQVRYIKGEVAVSIIFLLISLFFLLSSAFIESGNSPVISSAMIMPLILTAVMLITSFTTAREAMASKKTSQTVEDVFQKKVLYYIGAVFVYVVGLFLLPFWLISICFLLFSFLYWQALPTKKAIIVSLLVVVLTMLVFSKIFYITF